MSNRIIPLLNVSPGGGIGLRAPVIVQVDGKRTLELFRWGLIPWWAKDPAIGNRMINARAETLDEKPAFKQLLGERRWVILERNVILIDRRTERILDIIENVIGLATGR